MEILTNLLKKELKIKNEKIITNLTIISIILFFFIATILSTIGIETKKFNKLISDKASQTKNINLSLDTIKFKINPKELSLFLETQNPKNYLFKHKNTFEKYKVIHKLFVTFKIWIPKLKKPVLF